MAKIKLKYIGKHQPIEIIEVEEKKANGLIKRGDYILIEEHCGSITSFGIEKPKVIKKVKKDANSK